MSMHAHGAVHAARHHAEAHRHEHAHGHHEHGHGREHAHGHHAKAQAESHAPHANGTARPDAEPEPESLAWEPRWQKGQRTDAIAREMRWRRWVLEDNVMETIWMEVSPANAS